MPLGVALVFGLYVSSVILPAVYISRGYWAIGGEWMLILGAAGAAWWVCWKILRAISEGEDRHGE